MPRISNSTRSGDSRHWLFTLNNPEIGYIPSMNGVAYMIIGFKVSPSGKAFYEGYIVFDHPKRLVDVSKHIPGAVLAIKWCIEVVAIDYCKKDGDFQEWFYGIKIVESIQH